MNGIYNGFLERQYQEGMALARSSDLLEINPYPGSPPDRYVTRYFCNGLVREPNGAVVEANFFEVGVWFPSDYLRHVDPGQSLFVFGPPNTFHPNVRPPFICVGRIAPGTSLVDLIYQIFEILTYQKVTMHDALNQEAAAWARRNQHRFPTYKRPLKRRALEVEVVE